MSLHFGSFTRSGFLANHTCPTETWREGGEGSGGEGKGRAENEKGRECKTRKEAEEDRNHLPV